MLSIRELLLPNFMSFCGSFFLSNFEEKKSKNILRKIAIEIVLVVIVTINYFFVAVMAAVFYIFILFQGTLNIQIFTPTK